MLGLLKDILCAIVALAANVVGLLVGVVNLTIVAAGTAITALLSALPDMPAAPTFGGDALAYANWLMPIPGLVVGFGVIVTLWIATMAFGIIGRLFKVW